MDRGTWQTTVHGITKNWIWLRNSLHVHNSLWAGSQEVTTGSQRMSQVGTWGMLPNWPWGSFWHQVPSALFPGFSLPHWLCLFADEWGWSDCTRVTGGRVLGALRRRRSHMHPPLTFKISLPTFWPLSPTPQNVCWTLFFLLPSLSYDLTPETWANTPRIIRLAGWLLPCYGIYSPFSQTPSSLPEPLLWKPSSFGQWVRVAKSYMINMFDILPFKKFSG